jgi:hypothetical protein
MMWTKLDAKLRQNRKIKRAVRADPMSVLLWVFVLIGCGHEQTDGIVTADEIEDAAHDLHMDEDQAVECVKILVTVGLLHDKRQARKCPDCSVAVDAMAADGYFVHHFSEYNPTQDETLIPIKTLRWKRKQALKHSRPLCQEIQRRDGDRCCYCERQVDWKDRNSDAGGTYDHLDPNLFEPNWGNTLENVVVACRGCNGRKKDRTPEEWLAAGGQRLRHDPRAGRDLVATRSEPGPDLAPTWSRERDAHETVRAGSEPGLDLVATSNEHTSNGENP